MRFSAELSAEEYRRSHNCEGMETVSVHEVLELMDDWSKTHDKYYATRRDFFAAKIFAAKMWQELSSKNDILKHKIHLLSTVNEKYAKDAAADFAQEQARLWAYKPCESPVLREAQEAVKKYTWICKKEIREKESYNSWSLLSSGLEEIDGTYKSARDIVKNAIDVVSTKDADESQNVDKKKAEELLKELREIWYDSRGEFSLAMDEDEWDSDLEEERELDLY